MKNLMSEIKISIEASPKDRIKRKTQSGLKNMVKELEDLVKEKDKYCMNRTLETHEIA